MLIGLIVLLAVGILFFCARLAALEKTKNRSGECLAHAAREERGCRRLHKTDRFVADRHRCRLPDHRRRRLHF